MKILVCGSRYTRDRAYVFAALGRLATRYDIESVIHGGAAGADRFAGEWAEARGLPCVAYPADWEQYGSQAGPVRNREMLEKEKPDMVIAFPGGRGTADMVRQAAIFRVPVYVVPAVIHDQGEL